MIAIGDVDELNSLLGLAMTALDSQDVRLLASVQNDLFDLGADIATPGDDFSPSDLALRIVPSQVGRLEREIDRLNTDLEPLRSFILPGGREAAARVHVARSVARRAERSLVSAARDAAINPQAAKYLNRLSDLLFVLARKLNANGTSDVLWVPGGQRES